jgi:hypothetical protein
VIAGNYVEMEKFLGPLFWLSAVMSQYEGTDVFRNLS